MMSPTRKPPFTMAEPNCVRHGVCMYKERQMREEYAEGRKAQRQASARGLLRRGGSKAQIYTRRR